MTEEHLLEIEAIVAARLGLMTVHSRELLAALREARAAAIELGEALAENERYTVLERVQARCPWLTLFGEGEGAMSDVEVRGDPAAMNETLQPIEAAVRVWMAAKGWGATADEGEHAVRELLFIELVKDLVSLIEQRGVNAMDSLSVGLEHCRMDPATRELLKIAIKPPL